MDILVCIASYGTGQWNYLNKVLSEYKRMRHDVDVILDLTKQRSQGWESPVIDTRIHNPSIEKELVYEHRKTMANLVDKYDVYIYSEDDVLITESNIDRYIKESKRLPENEITGFLRYEQSPDDSSYHLIDCHPQIREYHPIDRHPNQRIILDNQIKLNGKKYFTLWNLHQGSYILTNEQLSSVIESEYFHKEPSPTKHRPHWWRGHQWYGILESGASDIYTRGDFNHKVLPKNNIEELLVHHLPNKYIKNNVFDDPYPLTLEKLKNKLNIY